MTVDLLVEGPVDEAVARKVIRFCGHEPGMAYGKKGWNYIKDKLHGFNVRAQYGSPILVLVDFMDTQLTCPPELVKCWRTLPTPSKPWSIWQDEVGGGRYARI